MDLSFTDLGRSVYVLGGSGVGKTWLLIGWIMQLINKGVGLLVIDPHAQMYYQLVAKIAATGDRRLFERVMLFNPLDANVAVGFNPLEPLQGMPVERLALRMTDVVCKIWGVDPLIAARMQRLMFHAFWLLSVSGLTLLELPWVLTDADFRWRLLAKQMTNSPLRQYWEKEFPKDPRMTAEWTQSTLNKAASMILDPDLRLVFGQTSSSIDFSRILTDGFAMLVNLSKGELQAETSHMLGAFVLHQGQNAALLRARDPQELHRPFVMVVDEFQNYATDNIQEITAESRKFHTSLIFAHQFYDQLRQNPELQAAVLGTVGNLAVFRVGDPDARRFVRDIFQPSMEQVKEYRTRYQKVPSLLFGEILRRFDDPIYRDLDEIWEYEARRLTNLSNREFWYKKRGPYKPQLLRSLELPAVNMTHQLQDAISELVSISSQKWARPKMQVQDEIAKRHQMLGIASPQGPSDSLAMAYMQTHLPPEQSLQSSLEEEAELPFWDY
jgi:hypothetical protein